MAKREILIQCGQLFPGDPAFFSYKKQADDDSYIR